MSVFLRPTSSEWRMMYENERERGCFELIVASIPTECSGLYKRACYLSFALFLLLLFKTKACCLITVLSLSFFNDLQISRGVLPLCLAPFAPCIPFFCPSLFLSCNGRCSSDCEGKDEREAVAGTELPFLLLSSVRTPECPLSFWITPFFLRFVWWRRKQRDLSALSPFCEVG